MHNRLLAFALTAVACAAPAAACEYPTMVSVPDGATASIDEMRAAQAVVLDYVAAMEAYLECVNAEIDVAPESMPDEIRVLLVQRHDFAFTELETVVDAFNEQRRVFNEANAESD